MMKVKVSETVHCISTVVLTVLALAIFTIFFVDIRVGRYPDDSVKVEGPFNLVINDKQYHTADLDNLTFPALVRGDHMTLDFDLPNVKVPNAMITIYQDHAAMQVYYDGELVFERGNRDSLMVGYGHYNILLPEEYAGMHVKVVFDIIEDEGDKSIPSPVINNSATYLRNFIIDKSFYLVIDIAIIILCLTIMLIACFFSGITKSFRRLVFLGISFFMMAIWELCSYDLFNVFSDDLILKGYLEYSSLYWGPFFLSIYFYLEFFSSASEKIRKIYKSITALHGIFSLVAFILHFCDIIHLPALLQIFHVILIINVGFMFIVLIKHFKKKDDSHKPMIVGLTIIIVLAAFDMIRFIIYKYYFTKYIEDFVSFLLLGFFLFLVAMLMDFLLSQKNNMYLVARAEAMDRLAHVDMMTGLANRRRCEEIFAELGKSSDTFAIISIDLNYLKLTNDKYGHHEGDKLLTDCAQLMKDACGDEPVTPGRVGGDEFIIIVPKVENDNDRSIMNKMDAKCADINKDRTPLPLSYAYGICRSDEVGAADTGIVGEACRIADERMYEMKTAMKARREDVL
ncbi:MAG: diguanylate cyclase [Lachnospiraceae bacterium]|nr:diguanylate cyclase [Lachnospiraceae bacterium]